MFAAHRVHFLFLMYVFLYCFASIYYITLTLRGRMLKLHPAQLSYHIYRPPLDISNTLILSSFFFYFKQHYAIQHIGTQEVPLALSAVIKSPRLSSPTDSYFLLPCCPQIPSATGLARTKSGPGGVLTSSFPVPAAAAAAGW